MIRPPNLPPTQPIAQVSRAHEVGHDNKSHNSEPERPGSHKGAVFRHSPGPRPRPRAPQRNAPMRRKAIQGNDSTDTNDYDKETDTEQANRLHQMSTEVSTGDSDQDDSDGSSGGDHQRREHHKTLAKSFKALTPEQSAAAQTADLQAAAATPSPLQGTGKALMQQYTQRLFAVIDRVTDGKAAPGTLRAAIYADSLTLLRMVPTADLPETGLAGSRADLIQATQETKRVSGKTELARTLNQLAPLLRLNIERPRTASQLEHATAKLTVLQRNATPPSFDESLPETPPPPTPAAPAA
jgi:hypothetical protein